MSTEHNQVLSCHPIGDSNTGKRNVIGQLLAVHSLLADLPAAPDTAVIENREATASVGKSAIHQRRAFVLSVVQPGLAGLMDGSISSLAPLFAAAFATRDSHTAFLVGLATAIGAGVSMSFSEGLSDDGKLSWRGSPWLRGAVCGLMTFLGAVGHTLPFLIPAFLAAALIVGGVVIGELLLIAWIRHRYMDTPLLAATFQVVVGGVIVFAAGILIGSS
jgi:hypothetical protein